jgi:acid phosphatase (class A)
MEAMMNRLTVLILAAVLLGGCAAPRPAAPPVSATVVGELRPGILNGYLEPAALPDSAALLPAPPAAGSAAQAADDAAYQALTGLQGTPRGALAVQDADLKLPQVLETFSCAVGIPISESGTPTLAMLLRRTMTDAGFAPSRAKKKYNRTRPFVVFHAHTCTPGDEAYLVTDGSYPSGHASIGWAWALTLAELAPDHADAILERGRAFGQSRAICGAHWQSDVQAGWLVGAATVARLHANATFIAQQQAARAEIAAARARGAQPPGDCTAAAAALASSEALAP